MNNVIRSKITLFRNIKDYKFVPKLNEEAKTKIINLVTEALPNFNVEETNNLNLKTTLYGLNATKCRTMLVNKLNDIAVTFFDEEHVNFTSACYGFNKAQLLKVVDLVNNLNNKINFAYTDEFGFLTSNLNNVGNGLKLECDFVLTGLFKLGKISQVKQNVQKLRFNLEQTEDKEVYTLSTICNLGYTQQEVINEFEKMVQKLQELEIESVKMLASTQQDEVYDAFVRAVAILKNAHILNYDELKNYTNQLRIGLNLGYKEVDCNKVEKLQQIILNKNGQFVSKSELIELANNVKNVLKGGE